MGAGVSSDVELLEIGASLETEVVAGVGFGSLVFGIALAFFFFQRSSGSERGLTDGAVPWALDEARLGSFGSFVEDFFEGMMNDG